MWQELLDGLVKAFLAGLAIAITSGGLYAQLWIRDKFKSRSDANREKARLAEEGERIRTRVHIRPNGAEHSEDNKDIDSDENNRPTGAHPPRRRVRSGKPSPE